MFFFSKQTLFVAKQQSSVLHFEKTLHLYFTIYTGKIKMKN